MQPGTPSIQWACLRHWVVTIQSAAAGGQDVDKDWKKRVVHTAADNRLVGPIREVSTDANTLEIFDDENNRAPIAGDSSLTLQLPLASDLVIVRTNIILHANCVTGVTPKQLYSFVLECKAVALYKAMALCFKEVKKTYVVKGRPMEASPTAMEVTSENQDELVKVAKDMLMHLVGAVVEEEGTIRKRAEEAAFLKINELFKAPWKEQLKALEYQLGFRVADALSSYHTSSSGGDHDDPPAEGIADWIRLANSPNAPPRPLIVFFVEGPADEDFAKAAMVRLDYDRKHLKILEFSRTFGDPPSAMLLREGLLGSGITPKQLSAVDFVVLEDSDLRLLSVNDGSAKPFGRIHQREATRTTSATYSHRWRFGRALENYMIPSLAPLALLQGNHAKAFDLSVEAICKISTQILWNSSKKKSARGDKAGPSADNSWATGLVAKMGQEAGTLITEFERQLGFRLLGNPATLKHFVQQLHRFLCMLEDEGAQDAGAVDELATAIVGLTAGGTAAVPTAAEPGPPLQELLARAAKIVFDQTAKGQVASVPHKALCRVLFKAQEAYIDLMANTSTSTPENMSQELFLCGHQTEGGGECGCQQLLLVGVDPKKATLGTCSCCGHPAAEHNKRFTVPNVETANSEGFYAALCMSGALLWHSHDYLIAIRLEQRLGGGSPTQGVPALSPAQRSELYRDHLWWLASNDQGLSSEEYQRGKEVGLLQKHYSGLPVKANLATGPMHAAALRKLCLLRQRQRAELHGLFHRLHADQSAAKRSPGSLTPPPATAGGSTSGSS